MVDAPVSKSEAGAVVLYRQRNQPHPSFPGLYRVGQHRTEGCFSMLTAVDPIVGCCYRIVADIP